jgi:hypothetical protein
MRIDVLARLPFGIAVEPVPDDLDIAHQRIVGEHLLDQIVIDAEEIEKAGQVGRVPFAVQVGFGDADVAATEQPRCKTVIVERHRRGWARLDAAEPQDAAVGKGDVKGAAPQF